MSISVTCRNCGKALKLKDEAAGRLAKCPECMATFTVPGGGSGYDPAVAAAARKKRMEEAGKFEIPWRLIFGGGFVLLIVIAIGAFLMGPKKVWGEWEALGEQPNNDVTDIVTNALRGYLIEMHLYDPRRPGPQPYAHDVMFFRPGFVMSMPASVKTWGSSSAGPFTGRYNIKSREVDAELEIAMLATGKGSNRVAPKITIHGKMEGNSCVVEVNGKKVDPYPNLPPLPELRE